MCIKISVKTAIAAAAFALAVNVSFVPTANAVSYSTSGSPEQFNLGDTIGSPYDQLIINPYSGTLAAGTILLNPLEFIAGINAEVPHFYNNISSISEAITVGSNTQSLVLPFNLDISYSDTLTIIGGTTLTFSDAGSAWQIVVNGLKIGPNSGGPLFANLTAEVSQVPLPAALPLYASGLGVLGIFGWWRKRRHATKVAMA